MKKIKNYLEFMSETVSTTRKEQTLVLAFAMLAGCVLGMLISPKKTIYNGNGNGTQYFYGPSGEEEQGGE